VKGAMVGAAQRHRELIADPAAQGPWLHESEVMGVARLPPAQQACLRRHELQMCTIAVTARLAQGKGALVDMANNGCGLHTGMASSINALIWTSRDNARFSPLLSVVCPSGAPTAFGNLYCHLRRSLTAKTWVRVP
jgi:hypothetical protein